MNVEHKLVDGIWMGKVGGSFRVVRSQQGRMETQDFTKSYFLLFCFSYYIITSLPLLKKDYEAGHCGAYL
jgi:hypothetical protein